MISFRFHVVSITAIFLAIAIGVVIGSTYVDTAVADLLRNRINTVEESVDDARAENARLEGELEQATGYIDASADFTVTDRLTDVPVMVVAARGVDEAAVERTVALARRAGGSVPGVVWIEPRWAAEAEGDLEALREIVGGLASDEREELWADAWQAVVEELAAPDGSETSEGDTSGGPDDPAPQVLTELEAAAFLTVDSLDDADVTLTDLAGAAPRMLVVTGARAQEEVAPVLPLVIEASVGGGLVTVVADVYVVADEAPGRGTAVTEALEDPVRDAIVIVDDADLEEGGVAAVLGLDSAADGEVGVHYGYGEGADGVLPGWTEP